MSGHPVLPAKYSTDCSFKLSKLAQIVSVGAGFRSQKGQRDNFTREPPCLQQSILGDPVCMKSREDQTRALLTLRIHACTFSLTEMSIPCNLTSILFLFIIFFRGGGERGRGRAGVGYVSESQNIYACADGMFALERKTQYLQTPALERRTKRVIPGFRPVRSLLDAVGPSLLSATDLASRYGIEGEICRPLNHM